MAAQFEAAITAYCRETSPSYNPRSESQADLGPITHGKPPQKGMNNMDQGTTESNYSMENAMKDLAAMMKGMGKGFKGGV